MKNDRPEPLRLRAESYLRDFYYSIEVTAPMNRGTSYCVS